MSYEYDLPVCYDEIPWRLKKDVRNQYVEEQNGECMYCNNLLSGPPPKGVTDKEINWDLFPPNFLKHPVHLQHCHQTGMTEGAVHAYCNAVLWQYENR